MIFKSVKIHGLYDIKVPIKIADRFEDELCEIFVLASLLNYSISFKQDVSTWDISNSGRAAWNRLYLDSPTKKLHIAFVTDCHGLLNFTILGFSTSGISNIHFDVMSLLKDAL